MWERKEVAQPGDRVRVEVVRRLVQQQRLRTGEQDPGELDPPTLTTGQGLQPLGEDAFGQAEARGDRRGFGLRRVATLAEEVVLQSAVPVHRVVVDRRVGARHPFLLAPHAAGHHVELASGQDAVAGEHVEVAGAWVLGQVADSAAALHLARRRRCLTGQHLGQRGLAGAVAADQSDPVAGGDPERRTGEQELGARAELDVGGGDHGEVLEIIGGVRAGVWTRPAAGAGTRRCLISSATTLTRPVSHARSPRRSPAFRAGAASGYPQGGARYQPDGHRRSAIHTFG